MTLIATALLAGHENHLMHLFLRYGLFGLFFVSVVDSSFIPLPLPGITDIMLVLFAAQHQQPWLLIVVATAASALGGWLSYRVGQAGGMAFIEKRTPPRIYKRITTWMESHAILAVALPALLPPPMPLSPFVLAAGALHMSQRKFLVAFTLSRLARHAIAVWAGVHYGRHILKLWFRFSDRYGTEILVGIWILIAITLAVAAYQLWRTRTELRSEVQLPASSRTVG